jgi:hypothetical protein
MDIYTLNIIGWTLLILSFATPLFEKDEEKRHLISFILSILAGIVFITSIILQHIK